MTRKRRPQRHTIAPYSQHSQLPETKRQPAAAVLELVDTQPPAGTPPGSGQTLTPPAGARHTPPPRPTPPRPKLSLPDDLGTPTLLRPPAPPLHLYLDLPCRVTAPPTGYESYTERIQEILQPGTEHVCIRVTLHHEHALGRDERQNAIHRLLDQAAVAAQPQQLLGAPAPRQRPQTGPLAPGQDDDVGVEVVSVSRLQNPQAVEAGYVTLVTLCGTGTIRPLEASAQTCAVGCSRSSASAPFAIECPSCSTPGNARSRRV